MNDPAPLPSEHPLNRSTAYLRLFGDDLDPDEITALLGHPPTSASRRGDQVTGRVTGRITIEKTGRWSLKARDGHGDFDVQIAALLDLLTADLGIWSDLSRRYSIDVFCGFFMGKSNSMTGLEISTMAALSGRGIAFTLDLYDPIEEDE